MLGCSRTLSSSVLARLACAAGLVCAVAASNARAATEAYTFNITTPSSLLTYSFTAANPFTGTLAGAPADPLAVPPLLATRLKRATAGPICLFVSGCTSIATTVNDTINISGSVTANGQSSTTTPIRPGGSFVLGITPPAGPTPGSAEVRDVSLNLLASGAINATASLSNFTYQPFCAAVGTSTTPTCTAPFCAAITFALGSVSVTAINAVATGPATGTLTPVVGDANSFDFSVPVVLTVTTVATFQGSSIAGDPTSVPAVLTGRVTRTTSGATLTGSTQVNIAPPANTTPTVLPPSELAFPADAPLCANLRTTAGITLTSSSFTSNNTANIVAAGSRLLCRCDTDASGAITIDDIFLFLGRWFANDPRADFNGSGTLTVDDIFEFLGCFFANPFPC